MELLNIYQQKTMEITKSSENYDFIDTYKGYEIEGSIQIPNEGHRSVNIQFHKDGNTSILYVNVENGYLKITSTEDFLDLLRYYVTVMDQIENFDKQ